MASKRRYPVFTRLTGNEKALLDRILAKTGLSLAALIRRAIDRENDEISRHRKIDSKVSLDIPEEEAIRLRDLFSELAIAEKTDATRTANPARRLALLESSGEWADLAMRYDRVVNEYNYRHRLQEKRLEPEN